MNSFVAELISFSVALFSALNPIGAIPIYLSLTGESSKEDLKKIALSCTITIFITLILSTFAGVYILKFFGIGIPAFRLGGGILIASMAFNMLQAKRAPTKLQRDEISEKPSIAELGAVPLAIPLLAGPGTISTALLYGEKLGEPYHWAIALVAILIISVLTHLILSSSKIISNTMGKVGINIMTRVMGLILMAKSVEFIALGIKQIFL